jgi:cardiolipin synthase A/B
MTLSTEYPLLLIGAVLTLIEGFALVMAVDAIMKTRTSQGAIAWAISLVTFPFLSLPLYLIFGKRKFHGYVYARRAGNLDIHHISRQLGAHAPRVKAPLDPEDPLSVFEKLAVMPFTHSNRSRLLIDGEANFTTIFSSIDAAREYILVQYYIIRDDRLGREFQNRLIARAEAGVRVYLLYDEIGCFKLPDAYTDRLRKAGVRISPFGSAHGKANRFQLNFRNHRKIVVVDGEVAYVGGFNVGDEYMGRGPKIGPWRDTNVEIAGPSVQCLQLSFLEDWYWATHAIPELDWTPRPVDGGSQNILVLPSGPADTVESCTLFFLSSIHSARKRLWIASPYFVPDAQIVSALQLAALRGVDVRLLLPEKADHLLVYLSSFSYLEDCERVGVKVYRYQPGFLHQKVMLVDDNLATVGTANLDNRSFRLNFEISILFADPEVAVTVEKMLLNDFSKSRRIPASDLTDRSFPFRLAVRISRLLAPLQ